MVSSTNNALEKEIEHKAAQNLDSMNEMSLESQFNVTANMKFKTDMLFKGN
jgi:hypothetical protein